MEFKPFFSWKTGNYSTDSLILMTIFNLKIQLLIGLPRIESRAQKSVLTGLLFPDPKLLHKGRHAIIGQTYTQHIPLRCARFAHQEGLLDTECICESVGNVQPSLRGMCVCVWKAKCV